MNEMECLTPDFLLFFFFLTKFSYYFSAPSFCCKFQNQICCCVNRPQAAITLTHHWMCCDRKSAIQASDVVNIYTAAVVHSDFRNTDFY